MNAGPLKLAIAWIYVGIPLAIGIYVTGAAALKLFE
jgi:hypothetical protein